MCRFLVLLRIAEAMAMPVDLLLRDDVEVSSERGEAEELLRQLDGNALREALTWLGSKAFQGRPDRRARRIGLIGLRGGGKSALGKVLAEALELPFIELNRVIEAEYGGSLDDLFSLAGQPHIDATRTDSRTRFSGEQGSCNRNGRRYCRER